MLLNTKSTLAAGFLSIALATPALCQSREQYQASCQNDAMRLCSPVIPDEAKIHSCLIANKASLSPACRAVVSPAKQKKKPRKHTH